MLNGILFKFRIFEWIIQVAEDVGNRDVKVIINETIKLHVIAVIFGPIQSKESLQIIVLYTLLCVFIDSFSSTIHVRVL